MLKTYLLPIIAFIAFFIIFFSVFKTDNNAIADSSEWQERLVRAEERQAQALEKILLEMKRK